MEIVLLLALLTASGCFGSSVVGQTGENVTLTCKYDRKYYGALRVCWNRGDIPYRGCNNQLIATDGHKVNKESGVSSRYQLTGQLDEGDVSLTILNLTESDAGRYGCRVDIPGWFNDDKHHFDLTVGASGCFGSSVVGQTGENVTLTCKYDRKYYGALRVCWNRGDISYMGCNNQLIATDGHKVNKESGVSSRYQLTGRLDEGDVSLTILNLTESDAGRYGCRVDIPGWFNDDKHHFDLTVGASGCFGSSVVGQTGENVTLTCKYDRKYYGALRVCWNRGDIPYMGCNNQLISTDGHKVNKESGVSSRYQLTGRLDEGDVSLTILNLTESDAGRYGCRVAYSGWFNDDKHHFDLTVGAPLATTMSTTTAETSTESTAANQTAGHTTSTESSMTSSTSSISSFEKDTTVTVVLVCVLFGLVALLTAGGLVFIMRRCWQLNKMPQTTISSLVQFSPSSSSLELQSRGSAVENIYHIDGGDYEYCP